MLRKLYKIMRKNYSHVQIYRLFKKKWNENCEIFKSANLGSEPYLVILSKHV